MREYPDDAACLDRLWRDRFAPDGHHAQCPRCERERKFHRTKTRASYTCDSCGLHVHPMKGTIFERSTTSLHLWFYALYLIASTRCGISAKQLERELGVTYKTAHRMFKRIRTELMADIDDDQLSGDVEIDETSWGGKPRTKLTREEAAAFREAKPTILGMVERGGRVRLRIIPSRRGLPLGRLHRPPDHQPLQWPLRRWGHSHEHHRGVLRQPQDRDARRLQARIAALPPVLSGRVRLPLQPAQGARDVQRSLVPGRPSY
jgi:transposase-like protein